MTIIEIKVPILPESVSDAVLLNWKKKVGDVVSQDEILIEVETDKVVLEVTSPKDGILTEIVTQSGATVLPEQVLAKIKEKNLPKNLNEDNEEEDYNKLALGPAVREIVAQHGIDPQKVVATGQGGRLTKEDVLKYISREDVVPNLDPRFGLENPSLKPENLTDDLYKDQRKEGKTNLFEENIMSLSQDREEIRIPMSRIRQTIANRLVQSQQNSAILTTFNEVNMKSVLMLRERYKNIFQKKYGVKLGFMSFFVKSSVSALQQFPTINSRIDGTDIIQYQYHDIGIAISSIRGLVVPILRNCEKLSFSDIELQILDFRDKAQDGKIDFQGLSGGTFTITNGGVFGSLLSTPIINPPQSAILGMHTIQERPIAENGQVIIYPMMYLALSYDHRIIDGKEAVNFLLTVKETLEDPIRLLLDC